MLSEKSIKRIGRSVQHTEQNPLYGVVQSAQREGSQYLDLDNRIFAVELNYLGPSTEPYEGNLIEYDLASNLWAAPTDIDPLVNVIELSGKPLDITERFLVLRCAYDDATDLYTVVVCAGQYASQTTPGIVSLDHANPASQKMGTGPKSFDYIETDGLISYDEIKIQLDANFDDTPRSAFQIDWYPNVGSLFSVVQHNITSLPSNGYVGVAGGAAYADYLFDPGGPDEELISAPNIGFYVAQNENTFINQIWMEWTPAAAFNGPLYLCKSVNFSDMGAYFDVSGTTNGYGTVPPFVQGTRWSFHNAYDINDARFVQCGMGIDYFDVSGFAISADCYIINSTYGTSSTDLGMVFTGGLRTGGTLSVTSGDITNFDADVNALIAAAMDQGTW